MSHQASKITQVVGIDLASVLVFVQCIQASILNQPLGQLAHYLATPYRFVRQRVQVEGHVGEQSNAPLAVAECALRGAFHPIGLTGSEASCQLNTAGNPLVREPPHQLDTLVARRAKQRLVAAMGWQEMLPATRWWWWLGGSSGVLSNGLISGGSSDKWGRGG